MTRKEIVERISCYVVAKGVSNCKGEIELNGIFNLCTTYGFDLEGSTIDKIVTEHGGHLRFYFNENTDDYGYESEFKVSSLVSFFDALRNAFNEEDLREIEEKSDEIRPIVDEALSSLVSDVFDRSELVDNIIEDVTTDILETADEEYNDSDVRLAIVRTLLKLTNKN